MTTFQPAIVPGEAPPPDSVRPRDSTAQAPTSVARLSRDESESSPAASPASSTAESSVDSSTVNSA